ncbi:MAG: hydrogenase iron-sulfur subunit [Bacillota bacterium]|uniref:Hydrogenase iron-sulfur subunit n=1 Tax=Thermanaerosceptrum fracticalcis TaxID=1712410 RepID=A0A7G6E3P5_THEFR|nr:hydrogenase iron-sulfur subunit [Thermanaerosceptrum fracticalcis]QNB46699.1 hydrogenase iron-sulfur subunit [Thermanaerosceptrum fracticalcis]
MTGSFEPKIVGILCNWCSYAGADLAGTSRLKYPANIHIVRVMCSGRVDPTFVLKAFELGADGVLVSGCRPGDCHYVDGNYKTMRRTPLLENLLRQMGVEPARFRQVWVSASQGEIFARIVEEMVKDLKEIGPYMRQGGEDLA